MRCCAARARGSHRSSEGRGGVGSARCRRTGGSASTGTRITRRGAGRSSAPSRSSGTSTVAPGPAPLAAITRGPAPHDGGGPMAARNVPWWVVTVAYDAAWADPTRRITAPGAAARARRRARADARALRRAARGRRTQVERRGRSARPRRERGRWPTGCWARARQAPEAGAPVVEDPARHRARIEAALEAIGRGEIYQVNLARPWRAPYSGSPVPLWRAMRGASEVPLGAFVQTADRVVIARTMERFVRWDRESRRLWTSPIKGTLARRGDDASEAEALRADDKERAEHSMIVDLMRNDLSRVATTGSVVVREPLRVEPFREAAPSGLDGGVHDARRRRRARDPGGDVPARQRDGHAEAARDGAHRGTRRHAARALHRSHRLPRSRRAGCRSRWRSARR